MKRRYKKLAIHLQIKSIGHTTFLLYHHKVTSRHNNITTSSTVALLALLTFPELVPDPFPEEVGPVVPVVECAVVAWEVVVGGS